MKRTGAFEAFLKKKRVSQSEAARRMGVPHPTVWRWLHGKAAPSPLARVAIKANLGFEWKD